MSLMTHRLLSYTLGIACVFGFSASFAVAAAPGWGAEKMAPGNYRWRPVPVRSASAPAAPRGFRPAVHRDDPPRGLASRHPGNYSSRLVGMGWRPFPAARPYVRYGAPDRRRPRYACLPSFRRPAVSPMYGPQAYYGPLRPPRYAAPHRLRGDGRKAQPQTVAGYRFRPLTEREKHRRLRRGDAPVGVPAFVFPEADPRTSLLLNTVPRRFAHGSALPGKPYLPFAFRPAAQIQDRIQRVARPLPDFGPPLSYSFHPGWSAAMHDRRLSRFKPPRPPGSGIARQLYTGALPWRPATGFGVPPVWKPRHMPVRHQHPWQGRAITRGSHLASIPVSAAES